MAGSLAPPLRQDPARVLAAQRRGGVAQGAAIWQFPNYGRHHAMPNLSETGGYLAQ
jgi:hypothetical protein